MTWKLLKSVYVFVCPWLKVRKDHIKQPSEFELDDFYVVETSDWVNVIAITEDGKVVLEEQYRHGIQKECIELPAGCVDQGEIPLEAAKRELLEETGYAGGVWIPFGESAPNASGMATMCYTFIAKGVKKISAQNLEQSEDIRICLVEQNTIKELLEKNSIVEAVMQASLWRYLANKI